MNKSLRTKLGSSFTDCTKWRLGGSSVCRVHTIRTTHTAAQQLEYKLICENDPFEPVYKYTLLCGKIVSTLENGTHPPETAQGVTNYEVILVTHCTKNVKTRDDLVDFIIEAETNWEEVEAKLKADLEKETKKQIEKYEAKTNKEKLDFLLGLE